MSERAAVPAVQPSAPRELDAKLSAHIAAVFGSRECASVACIGAETYFGAVRALAGRDVLVVEPSPSRVQALEQSLPAGAARSVAICQEHPLNRLFRREAMHADAVLAIDPVRALAHHSGAEHANIAELLADTAVRAVVVASPYEQRSPTRRVLEERFRSIGQAHFGWPYGGWDVMVCAKD
jgi:hypothetical protein